MNHLLLFITPIFLIFSCSPKEEQKDEYLKEGMWRGNITIAENKNMPFLIEVKHEENDTIAYLINASEKIELDEVYYFEDSVKVPLHIFDAALVANINENELNGYYIRYYEDDYKLPFQAIHGINKRFVGMRNNPEKYIGTWDVTFKDPKDTINAIGKFKADGNEVSGTFLLSTGDYRYLEGAVIDDTLRLSTFDGNHAYLFHAYLKNDTLLKGEFWSGKDYHATWTGIKDSTVSLPSADSLTYLKEGYDQLTFSFPDLDSNMVSPEDYRGKVLIIQIFGSWCPNCMDETKFLAQWYSENKELPVEILGLAYEAKDDFSYARSRIIRMKNKLGPQYKLLIAGTKDKESASGSLPMLNKIVSFPTLIFLDAQGDVRRIHTGFSGPGTGEHFKKFKEDFNATVNELVEELQ
ncbi:MAG: TlpA disulfide reductase family protein [Candidatus Cyclobacteriaceae bacterium M2_1C_046]